jgi:hypothetical protein
LAAKVNLESDSEDSEQTVDTSNDAIERSPECPELAVAREYGEDILRNISRTENENSEGLERHEIKGRHRK